MSDWPTASSGDLRPKNSQPQQTDQYGVTNNPKGSKGQKKSGVSLRRSASAQMVAFKVSLYLGVSYLTNLSPGEGTLVPRGNNLTPAGQWKTNGPPQRCKRSLASATLRIQQPLVPCTRATNYYVSSKPKDIPATSRGLQRQHG